MRKLWAKFLVLFGISIMPAFGVSVDVWPAQGGEELLSLRGEKGYSQVVVRALTIIVTYDNNPYKEGLSTAWGFSCLIRGTEKTILFDTGGRGSLLLANMTSLGIDPEEIDAVVISHIHGDHVGGMEALIERNRRVIVYLPASFPASFKRGLGSYGVKIVEVHGPRRICEGVYSLGELGSWLKEQSLVIHTDGGLIVITGCAHPGIVKIVSRGKDLIGGDVLLVMGGFHLGGESRSGLEKIIERFKELGVKNVGPCHCSGDLARKMFQQAYGEHYIRVGVGRTITFE